MNLNKSSGVNKDKTTWHLKSLLKEADEAYKSALELLNFKYFPKKFKYFNSSLILLNYSIELCLKIILLNQNLKMQRTHNLIKLWNCCKDKVKELNEMKIDEYIIMLNRVNYPNAGIKYPSREKDGQFSIKADIFIELQKLLNFTLNSVDPDKEINNLI